MDSFAKYFSMNSGKSLMNPVQGIKGNRRKGAGAILKIAPKPNAIHQNVVRKQDKLAGERVHPEVEAFVKFNMERKDVTPHVQKICQVYGVTLPEDNEEISINSNSPVKIKNENGRYFLMR